MTLSKQTKDSIIQFAREHAEKHLSHAELSYFERLGRKTGETRDKIMKKMAKFKMTSEQSREARDDLSLYMSDYIVDLMEQGHSEQEALLIAKKALAADSKTQQVTEIQDKFEQYYLTRDPAMDEAIGLYYGGFMFFGLIIGVVTGFFLADKVFPDKFWIAFGIFSGLGSLLGTACGMLKHASLVRKK